MLIICHMDKAYKPASHFLALASEYDQSLFLIGHGEVSTGDATSGHVCMSRSPAATPYAWLSFL